ncbi:hypothetical protein BJX70DRAFT_405308 [Aspergillus crustosus]
MPPMPPEEYQSRHRLTEQQGIHFLAALEPMEWLHRWPEDRRRLFHDIRELGRFEFDAFNERAQRDIGEKPWRAQTKRRAIRLAHRARRCREQGKNERSWRLSLESEALERFTVEVSCPICRARLWRSEIEASVEASSAQGLSLEERREKRMPCRCAEDPGQNEDFHGVNEIFSDRAETAVHYEPSLPIQVGRRSKKKYELPDRVYGLNETRNLTQLLASTNTRAPVDSDLRLIRDTIEASPFKSDRTPLLFPFLLLEAKSDQVGDSAGAEMQSAFALRRLLCIQDELRAATGTESTWQTGPFVWFLENHGDQWFVKGSFVDDSAGPSPDYCILELWQGSICSRSGALQLLMIIDYIFDWARDGYRPSILKELNILAGTEMPLFDPDIFSTIQRRESLLTSEPPHFSQNSQHSRHFSIGTVGEEKNSQSISGVDPRLSLGVVRDLSGFDYQFHALCITPSNMEELTSSIATETVVVLMLENLGSAWQMTRKVLTGIETVWTGTSENDNNSTPEDIFYVTMAIELYVTTVWDIAQQVTCLAISESALHLLMRGTSLRNRAAEVARMMETAPLVEQTKMESFLSSIKRQSHISKLTASVNMLCLFNTCVETPGRVLAKWLLGRSGNRSARFVRTPGYTSLTSLSTLREVLRQDDSQDLGWNVRHSRNRVTDTSMPEPEPCLWPWFDPISQDKHGCVLIDSLDHTGNGARYCLYVISMYRARGFAISDIVESLSEAGLYYSTTQLDFHQLLVRRQWPLHSTRSTNAGRFWRTASSLDLLKEWIEGLKAQPPPQNGPGDTADSPLVISSGEESEEDGMQMDN